MSGLEFNNFLNKFVKLGPPIELDKFLSNLLVGPGQVDSLRADFKTKFLLPFFDKINYLNKNLSETQKIVEDSNKKNIIPDNKTEKDSIPEPPELPISKNIENIFSGLQNIEPMSPPELPISTDSDQISEIKESNIEKLQNLVDKISVNKINEENLLKELKNNKSLEDKPEVGLEQKTFGPKETIITFSSSTNEFISKKIDDVLKKEKEQENKTVIERQVPKNGIMDFVSSLVSELPALLAAVGGATVLAGMFWPEIKKFIGDKFGDKAAEVVGQLQGTINAIGKFFTIGGLQLKFGGMFKNVGELLGKIGDDLIKSFQGIFLGLADEGAEGAAKGAATAITKGGLFKGVLKGAAGAILKGTSKVVLKGIPLIGALISFADAYGRFKEGNAIQGTIDVAAGLTGLVPGLGTPISIGLSLLNAFIDSRSENKEEVQQQSINISSMLLKGIGMFAKIGSKLKFLPLIGTILTFGSAWSRFKNGETLKGIIDIASGIAGLFPGVGTVLSIGIGALNSFLDYQEEKGGFTSTSAMIGSWAKSLWEWAKNTSFVKTILNLTDGIKNLLSPSSIRKGLEMLNKVPYFGTFAGGLLAVIDSFQTTTDANGNKTVKFSFTELAKNLKKNIFKNMSALIPEGMGIRKWFAELLGVEYNEKDDSITQSSAQNVPIAASPKRELSKAEKNIIKNLPTEYNEENFVKIQEQGKVNLERRKEIDEKIKELSSVENQTPQDKADIKRLEAEKNILMEDQIGKSYIVKRYKELKENSKITTAEDYGITPESEKADLQKEISGLENQIKDIQKERAWSKSEHSVNKVKELTKKIEELKQPQVQILDGSKGVELFSDAIDQGSLSKQFGSLTYQSPSSQNLTVGLSPEDNMVAMKKGGAIDNTFKDLKTALDVLSYNITNLIKTNTQNLQHNQSQQPVIVNNSNSIGKMFDDHIKFSSERDEIFNCRLEWVRDNPYARII